MGRPGDLSARLPPKSDSKQYLKWVSGTMVLLRHTCQGGGFDRDN